MTMPTVPDTARLGDVDLHIKALAMAADAKLGTGYLFVPVYGTYTVNGNGDINITPALGGRYAVGALCQVRDARLIYGVKDYTDPVPPASIGSLIPGTRAHIYPINFAPAPDLMWYSVRTSVWRGSSSTNPNQWYGSQRAREGETINVGGIAWAVR